MTTYEKRLKEAMADAGVNVTALARAIKKSYQAVKKVCDGKSGAFNAENNSRAAAFLGVNPDWLATGSGSKTPASGAPDAQAASLYMVNTATWTPQALQAATLVNILKTDADRELVLEMINRVVLARTLQNQS